MPLLRFDKGVKIEDLNRNETSILKHDSNLILKYFKLCNFDQHAKKLSRQDRIHELFTIDYDIFDSFSGNMIRLDYDLSPSHYLFSIGDGFGTRCPPEVRWVAETAELRSMLRWEDGPNRINADDWQKKESDNSLEPHVQSVSR